MNHMLAVESASEDENVNHREYLEKNSLRVSRLVFLFMICISHINRFVG